MQAALTSRLQAQADNRANVPLDDVAQSRIIFGIVFRFHLVQTALLHKTNALAQDTQHAEKCLLAPVLSVLDGDLAEVHVTRVVINSGGRLAAD